MKKSKVTRSLLAACSIVALTAVMYGCVHSSDDPPPTDDTGVDMPDPAIAERTAITNAISAARTAVGMVNDTASDATVTAANTAIAAARTAIMNATNVPAEERTAHTGTVNAIASTLATALASRTDAMDEAAEAAAEAALALFDGMNESATDLAVVVSAVTDEDGGGGMAGVTATLLVPGVGTATSVTRSAEPMLGMWQGTMLTDSVPAAPATATNAGTSSTVVVYTDIEAPKPVPFDEVHTLTGDVLTIDADADTDDHVALISATDFTHAGRVNHDPDPTAADDIARVRGMFNGAAGEYRCTAATPTTCGSIESSAGVRLTTGWVFDPDSGAMAMMADASFAYFGWWLNTGTTEGVEAGAFHGVTDVAGADAQLAVPTDISALGGTATYSGSAAGQYAINPGLSTASGGQWTADATLTADFGNETAPGTISGMIDGFMAGGQAMDWSVALGSTVLSAAGAADTTGDTSATTGSNAVTWTVGGVAGAEAGSWESDFYAEGDNSVPTVATGMFTATHGTVGHMVGAFGAHLDE